MRVLLYVCIGLLSTLTLLGAYALYTLNHAVPEVSIEAPAEELSQDEIEAQLEALRPADYKEPTPEEVEAQLEALTPEDYVPPTEAEVQAQLEALKAQ